VCLSAVLCLPAATLKLIRKIEVGKGPDGIYFDPASRRVFTNNHGTHDVTAIDASSGEVVGTVKLEGDGEQAVIGGDGLIYVNSEDTAEVVAFDPKSLAVKKRMPIGVAKTPTGLAYDAKTNRLFIGCREKPTMVVMNAGALKTQPSAKTPAFDAKTGKIFLPAAEFYATPPSEPGKRSQRTVKPGSFVVLVVSK
jgi:DNA-binding beta-propeller fold protein YncE